ncbi:MAG: hypothetical protein UEE41_02970 [Acutalibacteraceae bacterium]|nr:hypothetical protein [Acutalibacteraceae bacterium]
MTLHDFSKLLYLRKEIIVEQKHLEELEKAIVMQQITLPDLPDICLQSSDSEIQAELERCKQLIERCMKKSIHEYKKLILYILNINDSMIRQIMFLRFIQGHTWVQVAAEIGGGNSPDSIRMMVKRYLAKCSTEIQS